MEWHLIDSAPKDGTTIEVKNDAMDAPVLAKYGEYRSPWGTLSQQFILIKDFDKFMPLPPGTLVIPTHWRPHSRS